LTHRHGSDLRKRRRGTSELLTGYRDKAVSALGLDGFGSRLPTVYVIGGAQGSVRIYTMVRQILPRLSASYVRMSRRITNVGGFYTYARQGLGRRAGGATAYIALLAYNVAAIGVFSALTCFGSTVVSDPAGITIPWQVRPGLPICGVEWGDLQAVCAAADVDAAER
jgi:hypothetical protein